MTTPPSPTTLPWPSFLPSLPPPESRPNGCVIINQAPDSSFRLDPSLPPNALASSFFSQLLALRGRVKNAPSTLFYIPQFIPPLQDKHNLWNSLIAHNLLSHLQNFPNVVFCWEATF